MEKRILEKMHEIFTENLPDSLYMNPYELAEQYKATPKHWKKYLKDPETQRFIEQEIAQITEIAARSALKTLSEGKSSSSDIQAAKQLLENSKLLKQKNNPKQHVIMTYLPKRRTKESNHEV